MEKVKNIAALIPAILFIYCGTTICYNSTLDFLTKATIHNEIANNHSLGIYLISLSIEIAIIFQNLLDSQKLI